MTPQSWAAGFRPSGWDDPLDAVVQALVPHYGTGPRDDLAAVRAFFAAHPAPAGPRVCAVVGTNGKTSTATFLARLLRSAGLRTGLSTSPHVASWTERVRVDGVPVPGDRLGELLVGLDAAAVAAGARLHFFDVLTLAAHHWCAGQGVDVEVLEAGIGGRLDAVAALDPEVTVLTGVGRDHEELLGHEPGARLREKVLAAPPGSVLVAAPLADDLEGVLHALVDERALRLHRPDPALPPGLEDVPAALRASAALAAAAARVLTGREPSAQAVRSAVGAGVLGRHQRGSVRGVPFLADVAHNPDAWDGVLAQLPAGGAVLVTAITVPRSPGQLAASVAPHADRVALAVTTTTTVRASRPAEVLAAELAAVGVEAVALPVPDEAFAAAFARARRDGLPVVVSGSNYLVTDFLLWAGRAS